MPPPILDRCPVCACDLSSHPPSGRCPDCGFEYDSHTRIWRSSQSWSRLAAFYAAVGLIAGVLLSAGYSGFGQTPRPSLPLTLTVACPALGLLWRRIVSGRITGRFVALTPAGVLVGTRSRPALVSWSAFDRLTLVRGVPKLRRRDDPVPVPLEDVFDSPRELAEFQAALSQEARNQRATPNLPQNGLNSDPTTE